MRSLRGAAATGLDQRHGQVHCCAIDSTGEDSLPNDPPMDAETSNFMRAGTLEELKAKGRLVVHGRHRPVLLVHEGGHVFALDNRCPHMGFPLDRGSVEDGILTSRTTAFAR